MKIPAHTLREALDTLDIRPLEFGSNVDQNVAVSPDFYVEPPAYERAGQMASPGPIDQIRDQLLDRPASVKVFLSGHVGSGKSTQINRLLVDKDLLGRFAIVKLRFEEQEWAFLDSAQILFRIAGALFDYGKAEKLLSEGAEWEEKLARLDARLYGDHGVIAKEGGVGMELNLVFVKLKQDLKMNQNRRAEFRALAETEQSILRDLLEALANDIQNNLAKQEMPASLLVLIDDLDKVRGPEQQKEIFETNLNALFVPSFRVLYTVPTSVSFKGSHEDLKNRLEHLYPIRVLDKAAGIFDPEKALRPARLDFFRTAVHQRVDRSLIDEDSIRLAAIYSGGVLRDFFRLLATAVQVARHNKIEVVEEPAMRAAIHDERLRDSRGIYEPDWKALYHVHQTNELRSEDDRKYLDQARVLECYNDIVWFEASPLLWKELPSRGG